MSASLEQLITTLKTHKFSLTHARKSVFLALIDKEAQTISELTKSLNNKLNRASIYRTIDLYEKLGVIQRLQIGWKYKLELSDAFSGHHHHMTCTSCGGVEPFEESTALELELKQLALEAGFTETGHQLEIRGICKACQDKS